MKFIAYYRISKERKPKKGADPTKSMYLASYGLDAQRDAATRQAQTGQLLNEYVEIESGKRADNRPQLQAALAECKRTKAVLLIARLDRLSRNVAFISALMESGVEFVACDMPTASRLTIHILAAVAEHEREMISARTKAALAAAKAQGVVLGNPRLNEAREHARATHIARRPAAPIVGMIAEWARQGVSFREMARRLNALNIRPGRGVAWYGSSVANVLGKAA